jgi:hypothetical protein
MLKSAYLDADAFPMVEASFTWCIQKFPDWVDNEIYAYKNKHSLRSDTKGYGGKTH